MREAGQQQRVTVGWRLRDPLGGDISAGARSRLDDDRLAPFSVSFWLNNLAATSVDPPAAKPTTMRIGLTGYGCAYNAKATVSNSTGKTLTMAAMDLIADAGLRPACFLNCSSNPTPAGYKLAFDVLDGNPEVKAILVSIFGGGTHIDRVAKVMHEIMAKRKTHKPVVFRMNGTGRDKADELMQAAGLHNHQTLESAVDAVVAPVKPA